MSLPVILRHGTKAQMDVYGPMQAGEVGFTTDEGFVYGSDGSANYLIGRAISGSSDPTTPRVAGLLYVNTTTSGMFFSTGSGWVGVGNSHLSGLAGNLDDIADGATYQRVAATEVDSSGRVTQIADGTNTVTAGQARTHINDATVHRSINDASTSSTALWSSQKINDQITAITHGVDWQDSVKSMTLAIPPGSPTEGDRYVIPSSGTGDWATHLSAITQYMTASGGWVYYSANEGMASWVEDQDVIYIYNGSAWVKMASVETHNNLSGVQGGQSGEFYHLTLADFSALTSNRDQTTYNTVSGMVSGSTQTGLAVNVTNGKLNFVVALSDATPSTTTSGSATSGSSANVSRADHQHKIGLHNFFGPEHQTFGGSPGYMVGTSDGTTLTWITKIDGGVF